MPKFKNVSPVGSLFLPLVGRVIEGGESFEVSDVDAVFLADQPDVWQPVTISKGKSE